MSNGITDAKAACEIQAACFYINQNHPLNGWFEKALKGLDTDTAP